MSDLQKAFAIADEWECIRPSWPQLGNKAECYYDEQGNEISRLEFAFDLAEMMLERQSTPIRQGGIEISFGFIAEWDLATDHEQKIRDFCSAWTMEGGEPRALMANLTAKKKIRK